MHEFVVVVPSTWPLREQAAEVRGRRQPADPLGSAG